MKCRTRRACHTSLPYVAPCSCGGEPRAGRCGSDVCTVAQTLCCHATPCNTMGPPPPVCCCKRIGRWPVCRQFGVCAARPPVEEEIISLVHPSLAACARGHRIVSYVSVDAPGFVHGAVSCRARTDVGRQLHSARPALATAVSSLLTIPISMYVFRSTVSCRASTAGVCCGYVLSTRAISSIRVSMYAFHGRERVC